MTTTSHATMTNDRPPSTPEMDLDKILVVDDQPLNQMLVRRILKNTTFTLSFASNGAEGLEKARAELPFLILSDIMMPGMDGFEMCEKLKADDLTQDAAVIFVTAHHRDADMVSKGLDMGADDYIYRPFQPSELKARVQAVARLKRAEMEARRRARTIARRNRELEFLNTLSLAATSSLGSQDGLVPLMPQFAQLLGARAIALFLLQDDAAQVNVASHSGQSFSTSVTLGSGADSQNLAGQVPPILATILEEAHPPFDLSLPAAERAISAIPMVSRERVIGALGVVHPQERPLTDADTMLLNSAAGIMAVAAENGRLFAEVQAFNRHLEQMVEERTRQLVEEKNKTEAILASMADGLLVLDGENRIIAANRTAEEMLGFHLDEMQGQVAGAQMDSELWRCVKKMVGGHELTTSGLVDLPDESRPGGLRSIQASAARMQGAEAATAGRYAGTVILLRDITALKEVERMKARFMAGVTHELKTPLAIIRVHANNLLTYHDRLPKRKQRDLLDTIQKQVALLERSVEDILDLTRLDAGATSLNREPVDLGALADEIIASMRPLAESKQINVLWVKPSSAVTVRADSRGIRRVIRNLLDNALKYTPDGGTVEVKTLPREEQGGAEIRVRDTGVGIPAEHHERIFERFYRVDPSHTIPGTGLGLAIVKEIITAHGGEIEVASDPGAGSTFTVTLP